MNKFIHRLNIHSFDKVMLLLIIFAILINGIGLLFPILRNDDPTLYANIAKQIILRNDWINLYSNNYDWLDKPHFPFWITALSFKLFGISSFTYMLPGFLFYIIGGVYTYKLAKLLYNSDRIAYLSALIYFSALHLLISSIDLRAEAYLLGEIVPASYYWLLYENKFSIRSLLLGAIFSAFAVMTKGIFVLITITSGLFGMWIYLKKWHNFIAIKWWIALGLILLFILPELLCLYWQFDLHPEKSLFGQTNISGIRFFFIDSQFGRFFNNGPIVHKHGDITFFIHTFLWAFLPWSLIFIGALYFSYKKIRFKQEFATNIRLIYLLSGFFPTFILFSLTKFQLDHYTNIIMPFATILCSQFLLNNQFNSTLFVKVQLIICTILWLIVVAISLIAFSNDIKILMLSFAFFVLIVIGKLIIKSNDDLLTIVCSSVLSVCLVYIFIAMVNGTIYRSYDIGYNVAQNLNYRRNLPLLDYKVDSLSLEFHYHGNYHRIDDISQLKNYNPPYYLLIKKDDLPLLGDIIGANKNIIYSNYGTTIDKVMSNLFNLSKLDHYTSQYMVIEVK